MFRAREGEEESREAEAGATGGHTGLCILCLVLFFSSFWLGFEPKTPGRTKLYRVNVYYTRPLKVKMRRRPVSDPNVFSAFLRDFSLGGFWGISVCAFSPSLLFLCVHAFPINVRNPTIQKIFWRRKVPTHTADNHAAEEPQVEPGTLCVADSPSMG